MLYGIAEPFALSGVLSASQREGVGSMDKDRIKGAAKQAKGSIKEAAGKVMGDAKIQAEGKAEKMAGKAQNTAGGIKDAMKGK